MVRSFTRFVSKSWDPDESVMKINYTKRYFKMMFAILGPAYLGGIAVAIFVWKFSQTYNVLSNALTIFLKNYEIWAMLIFFGLIFAILTPALYIGELVYNRYVIPIVTRYQWDEYSWLKSMVIIPGFAIVHVVVISLAVAAVRLVS